MEHMLSTCLETLRSNLSDPLVVDILRESKLLQDESDKVKEIIGLCNAGLNSSRTRLSACQLLYELVQQCKTSVFQNNASTWSKLLLQALQSYDGGRIKHTVCYTMIEVLHQSSAFPELMREFSIDIVPPLIISLLEAKSEWKTAALDCMKVCMKLFSGPCGPFRKKMEAVVIKSITSSEDVNIVNCGSRLYPYLAQCGNKGNKSLKHSESWVVYTTKVLATLSQILDELYGEVEVDESNVSYNKEDVISFGSITDDEHHYKHLQKRFSLMVNTLRNILDHEFPAPIEIPLEQILHLLCRSLSVNPKFLLAKPTNDRIQLAMVIPFVHISAFNLLGTLIECIGGYLLPMSDVVNQLFKQTILWVMEFSNEESYAGLRLAVYSTLSVWLSKNGAATNIESVSDEVIKAAAKEITPSVVKISSTNVKNPNDYTSSRMSKKQKRKGIVNDTNFFTSQKKVDLTAEWKTCEAVVEVLTKIVKSSGCFIKTMHYKVLIDTVIKILLKVQLHDENSIPYGHWRCRRALYKLLLAMILSPHPQWYVPNNAAFVIFSRGRQDGNAEVAKTCDEASLLCQSIFHSRAPSFNVIAESKRIEDLGILAYGSGTSKMTVGKRDDSDDNAVESNKMDVEEESPSGSVLRDVREKESALSSSDQRSKPGNSQAMNNSPHTSVCESSQMEKPISKDDDVSHAKEDYSVVDENVSNNNKSRNGQSHSGVSNNHASTCDEATSNSGESTSLTKESLTQNETTVNSVNAANKRKLNESVEDSESLSISKRKSVRAEANVDETVPDAEISEKGEKGDNDSANAEFMLDTFVDADPDD